MSPSQVQPNSLDDLLSLLSRRYLVHGVLEGSRLSCRAEREGRQLVVKPVLSEVAARRLQNKAEVLKDARLPQDCTAFELDVIDHLLVARRDWLVGETLAQRIHDKPLAPEEALRIGVSLLSTLEHLHRTGLLHRNLKPSNVVLTSDQKVVLVDLGWDDGEISNDAAVTEIAGTANCAYLAPEQTGALDYDVGEWSDLYSIGMLLFESLTGRCLIDGGDLSATLLRQLTLRVPSLARFGVRCPRVLDDFMQRLLSKDPRHRYQSSHGALHDAKAILKLLQSPRSAGSIVLGLDDRRTTLAEPAFVGREREMRKLHERLVDVEREPKLVMVGAESGAGKSRLLAEFSSLANRQGVLVLRSQGVMRESHRPFHMLASLAQQAADVAAADAAEAERLRGVLAEDRDTVMEIMPDLAKALGWTQRLTLRGDFGEQRSIRAFASLLRALGVLRRPTVVMLDDCQWADGLTFECLRAWKRNHADQGRLLVVVALRVDETPADVIQGLPTDSELRLTPLRPVAIKSMLESMAGPLPAAVVEKIASLADGSPFIASALLRGLVESEALSPEAQGWRVDPARMAAVQPSGDAAELLARRIQMLPPDTAVLLSRAAVLGKKFDLRFAAFLANQSTAEALAALQEGRRRRLVWMQQGVGLAAFLHDRIRAAFLESLDDEQRRDLHRRIAFRLQELEPDNTFELAYHFDAGGKSELALEYALRSAESARKQHALETAETYFGIAERGSRRSDRGVRYQIAAGLGEVLMLRGRYKEAEALLEEAAELADDHFAQAQSQCRLGELATKRGLIEEAAKRHEAALRLLRCFVPRSVPTLGLSLVFNVAQQTLHSLFPGLTRRRRQPSEKERLICWLFSRLAVDYWFVRGQPRTLWANLRNLNLAERFAPTPELAMGYSSHALGMSLIGWFSRGLAYARKSLQVSRELEDPWGQGQALSFFGVLHYATAEYRKCIEKCREAVRVLDQTGDCWEVHMARYQIAASLYRLGDMNAAVEEAKSIHASGVELGDYQASGIILDVWRGPAAASCPQTCCSENWIASAPTRKANPK